jgi:methylisocitrate lyase
VEDLSRAGAAGVQLEDQSFPKRCGHREGKRLVSSKEMVDRLKAAVDARRDPEFVIMARTDAIAEEGIEKAIERAKAYEAAGANMIFAEAVTELSHYKTFTECLNVPVLANITEFGKTPLFTVEELKSVNIAIALYPLSAFRAMNQAAEKVYQTIRKEGSQKNVIQNMQTREELYKLLDYYSFENKL